MDKFIKALIALAGLAFVLAVIACFIALFGGTLPLLGAEGMSRACTNLALIAIALSLTFKEKPSTS